MCVGIREIQRETAILKDDAVREIPHTIGEAGRPTGEHVCRVLANAPVTAGYYLLELAAPKGALAARAGQFFHLLCPHQGTLQPFFRRPMSIYAVDRVRGRLQFLYKAEGTGTRAMTTLQPGDEFNIVGPLGQGFHVDPAWRRILVLGRGVGLATLAPLAEMAAAAGVGTTAALSARSPELLMSAERFEAMGASLHCVTDEEGTSGVEVLEPRLRRLIEDDGIDAVFTCGSNRLLLLLQRLQRDYGLAGQVALEQQMACGLSMCFCCVRPFRDPTGGEEAEVHKRVCWEGPVFPLAEALAW